MTPDGPLVSIIVPNYNYARTLDLCLTAAVHQSYPRLEVIVVDDGSTDDSVQIARRHRVTLIESPNRGVSAARNLGAQNATGQILFFLDSDIALEPDAVQQAVTLLSQDPELGCVCGIYAAEPLIDDGPVEWYKVLQGHFWRVRCAGTVRAGFFSLGAVRREVFQQVGPFDETLRYTEDVEYGARLSEVARIELTPLLVGRHDDDAQFGLLLRKQFTRSIPLVSL
ncbi:glycosyltransferase, partial [Kineosporia mesophila]|nr:glycosyltransferase [Kineosporia mesophila]